MWNFRSLWWVYSVLIFQGAALAQIAGFEGRKIVEVQYSPPLDLHPADLARAQTLKAGAALRAENVAEAIDRLFATGRLEDIAVEAEPSGEGVIVRFVTKPARFIGGVSIVGKTPQPPNRGEIASATQLSLGALFRDENLAQSTAQIKQLLTANGFYESSIAPEVREDGVAQQVFLTFKVREGKRAKYEMPAIRGETKLPEPTIIRATGWRVPLIHWWRQVTDSRTRNGVRGIAQKYQNKDRLMAKVELEELKYNPANRRLKPAVKINPGPVVKVTALEAKVSKRVLKRYVPVFEEHTVDNDLLVEGARNLRDYFQSNGYYDVDVEFRMRPPENDLQTIEFVISQGERYKLVRVGVTGNKYFDTDTIRERMFMQPASFNLRRGRYSEAFRKKDEENIANLYRSNGFRDAKVTAVVDRNYQGKSGRVAATVQIEEGPQWTVDSLTLNGVAQVDRNALLSRLSSSEGQPFADVNMASDRSRILTYYYARGFPNADFKATWQQTAAPQHVNLVYTVTEGERQFVRGIVTAGLSITRRKLIDERLTLKPGDPLSTPAQNRIQKSFYDMGVFSRVDTAIENPEGRTAYKYILYNFEEANRYTMGIGFGAQIGRFGTPSKQDLSSPGGTTGFSPQVSLNANRLNFLGIGHTVSFRGVYSSLQKRASISYFAPRFQNREGRSILYTLLYDNTLDVRTFAARRQEASVQLTQKFSRSLTGMFRFAYRRVSVSDVVIPVLLVPQIVQPVRLGIMSINIAQDRRDNSADAHRGIYNTADLGVSTKYFGSQRSFGRLLLRNATYHSITRNIVLARQTQFGILAPFSPPAGVSSQESVPLPERFFGGGADSLRAFPYNQAGRRDTGAAVTPGGPASQPTGFPLGGNALFFNNVEARFPFLLQNLQGVLFHDMGNVYSSVSNISFRFKQRDLNDFNYTVHAVGIGVRYRTPIGPVRGDLAYSINPPAYLGFGGTADQLLNCNPNKPIDQLPSYCQSTRQRVSHFQFFFSIGQTF